jgi:hypothetical protein
MYKTIFAYLPSAKSAALLSGVAADLAARHQARVIGAHNSAKFMIYGGIPEDFEALHAQEQRQRADAIEKSFTEATAARGVQAPARMIRSAIGMTCRSGLSWRPGGRCCWFPRSTGRWCSARE